MCPSLCLAYHTVAGSASADFVLLGNFRLPDSEDILIVKDCQILLYTFLPTITCETTLSSNSDDEGFSELKNGRSGEVSSSEHKNLFSNNSNVSFVCKLAFFGSVVSATVLKDSIFHEYEYKIGTKIGGNCSKIRKNEKYTAEKQPSTYEGPANVLDDNSGEILESEERIKCTSAIVLAFENGRVITCAFDNVLNTFVTLSLHVLTALRGSQESGFSPTDMSTMHNNKMKVFSESYLSVYSGKMWHMCNETNEGSVRMATFCKLFIVALCHDEKTLNILALQSKFTRPLKVDRYKIDRPISGYNEFGNGGFGTELQHAIVVPWLQISHFYVIDVDSKFGFCDNRYFVRGLEFINCPNSCILGILTATAPEAIATHYTAGEGDIIGGMSLICLKFDFTSLSCSIIQRVDALPLDITSLVPLPSFGMNGLQGFICTLRDSIMWITIMDSVIYWEFLSPTALLNSNIAFNNSSIGKRYRCINTISINLDLFDYILQTCNEFIVLMPKSGGGIYFGKPITSFSGDLTKICWFTVGWLIDQVSAFKILPTDGSSSINLLFAGSGTELCKISVTMPDAILYFNVDETLSEAREEVENIHIPELSVHIQCKTKDITDKFVSVLDTVRDQIKMDFSFKLGNIGVTRDPKNISLPRLFRFDSYNVHIMSTTNGVDESGKQDTQLTKHMRPPHKTEEKLSAVPYNRKPGEIIKSDVSKGMQQAVVGISDDTHLVVTMEKYPLQLVAFIPLKANSRLVACGFNVEKNGTKTNDRYPFKNIMLLSTYCGYGTALLTLNSNFLDICFPISNRFPNKDFDAIYTALCKKSDPLAISSEDVTVSFGAVFDNTILLQVTDKDVLFINSGNMSEIIAKKSLLSHVDGEVPATVVSAHIVDSLIVCLYTNGTLALFCVDMGENEPKIELLHKLNDHNIKLCDVYKSRRKNNILGGFYLTILTEDETFYCLKLPDLISVICLTELTQVHQNLFTNKAHFQTFSLSKKTQNIPKTESDPKKKKRMTISDIDRCLSSKHQTFSNNSSKSSGSGGDDANFSTSVDIGDRTKTMNSINFREEILSIKLVDISEWDQGPTLLIFMTGRPLLIYRSYLLNQSEYAFHLHMHSFLVPIPSCVYSFDTDLDRKQVKIKVQGGVNSNCLCVNEPIVGLPIPNGVTDSDLNFVTVAYPQIDMDSCHMEILDKEGNPYRELQRHEVSKDTVQTNSFIESVLSVFKSSWIEFRPPVLRLTSIRNRLFIHEFEVDSLMEVDGPQNPQENLDSHHDSRIVSIFNIIPGGENLCRFTLMLTIEGNLLLGIPSILCQRTSANSEVPSQNSYIANYDTEDKSDGFLPEFIEEIRYNEHFCRIKRDSNRIIADLNCWTKKQDNMPSFEGEFITKMFSLDPLKGSLIAVSQREYYLVNDVVRLNRNAAMSILSKEKSYSDLIYGKLVAVVVKVGKNSRDELISVLNQRIDLQLKQLETEALATGTKPIDILQPNKQISVLLQTLDAMSTVDSGNQSEWRNMVLVLHMGNLGYWYAEYEVEPFEAVLSITFGIIGDIEYLLIGTCTNLGENIESKGDIIVLDLHNLLLAQTCVNDNTVSKELINHRETLKRSSNCVNMSVHCKKTFPGPITFLTSLNMDFDMLFRDNFDFRRDLEALGISDVTFDASQNMKWVLSHFLPNSDHFVHSVGQRIFVHELSGNQFVRGAFAEVPLCVLSACVFDKFIIAGDVCRGLSFFMYRHDTMNDSRTICKIGSTLPKVDLSIVACAPLVNEQCIGILASDFFGNLIIFGNYSDNESRETLKVDAAVRLANRVTHFVRREMSRKKMGEPVCMLGWTCGGSVIKAFMPECDTFSFFKAIQDELHSKIAMPLGIPYQMFSTPFWTSQMEQTLTALPNDDRILSLDLLSIMPFQPTLVVEQILSKVVKENFSAVFLQH